MRLDVVPENPAESVAHALGLLPSSVVKVVWSLAMGRALLAAVELGVFHALRDGPLSSHDLAAKLECDEAGVRTLCSALNAFRLLKRRDDVFTLAREAERYLTDKHGSDMSEALRFGAVLDEKLKDLAHTVRTGEKARFHENLREGEWQSYLGGLGAMASMVASEVVRKLPAKDPRALLDVGGGHGAFAAAMCTRHDALRARILDLPEGVRVGERLLAAHPARARLEFIAGDLRTTPWGEGHDVVFLFNILHNLEEPDAARAVRLAFETLASGGTLAILEGQHAGGRGNLSFQEGFGELLFHVLSASTTWPEQTLRTWLTDAGFGRVTKKKLLTLPGSVLLLARKV
jgi:ubiquinone/menaquinone biosynthesis C-methylase UbiE